MSRIQKDFALYTVMFKLPKPEMEYRFDPSRKWRFDFAWPDKKVAVEVDGETSHARYYRVTLDALKRNAAVNQGWQVYTITGEMMTKDPGSILEILKVKLQ